MKFLHTADWHAGKTLRNRSRIEELGECLREITSIADREQVDAVLVAGDLFDSSSPTPEAEDAVYGGLLMLAQTGAEVVLVAGNHDSASRLFAIAPLLEHVRVRTGTRLRKAEDGGILRVQSRDGRESADIALVPFLSQREAVRIKQIMELDATQFTAEYAAYCGYAIKSLCSQMRSDAVQIVLAHLHLTLGTLGGGERQAHTIDAYHVPAQAFPGCLHYVAMGHLHAPQKIVGACPIHYSGSPLQLDFGEEETQNSVLIVDAGVGRPAVVRPVALESGRKLMTLRGRLDYLHEVRTDAHERAYLRLNLDDPPTLGLADRARELFPNAVEVTLNRKSMEMGETEVDYQGLSPINLFELYLKERGETDSRLNSEFAALMDEVYATEEA